jgi:hypothetical protein
MLLPKGGVTWKSAKAQLPPTRAIWVFLTRTRFLLCVALAGIVLLLWRGVSTSASEMQRSEAFSFVTLIRYGPYADNCDDVAGFTAGDLQNRQCR